MKFYEGVAAAALLIWMASVPVGRAVGADGAALEGVLLFGGIAAVALVWLLASLALSTVPEAASRRRFAVALVLGLATGLYFPVTRGWGLCISLTRFYPWGALGYILYGFAALLAGRVAWRRWRVAVPPSVAVAAAWAALFAFQFLLRALAAPGGRWCALCGWVPFSLAGLDAHAPYHAALAAGLVAMLARLERGGKRAAPHLDRAALSRV